MILAVGIQAPPVADRTVIFEPNLERDFGFNLVNAPMIHSYLIGGILENYSTLVDPAQDSGPRSILVKIKLPESLTPGTYGITVGGKEISKRGDMISAVGAIQSVITVVSLYDGKYPDFSLQLEDAGANFTSTFRVLADNYGYVNITSARGIIDVYDVDGKLITTLYTNSSPVPSKLFSQSQSTALAAQFRANDYALKPGIYKAVARLEYDGETLNTTHEGTFRVGSLVLTIASYTKNVFVNSTNKFDVVVTSDWIGSIDDVYARITTPNHGVLKTPNLDVYRFDNAVLSTYWETDKLAIGTYNLTIEVFYGGLSSKTIAYVNVTEGKPPEEVKETKANQGISNTAIVIVILVILLVINISYFVFKGRNSNIPPRPPSI